MPRGKKLKPEGDTIEVEPEQIPEVAISQNAAKKLVKKDRVLSEKQKAHIENLVAKNREKWAKLKEEKSKPAPKVSESSVKEVKTTKTVIVKPKRAINRVHPGNGLKKKKVEPSTESEDSESTLEEESSEEESTAPPITKAKTTRKVEKKIAAIKKIDKVLKATPASLYESVWSKVYA
jgi:hypothetical protein